MPSGAAETEEGMHAPAPCKERRKCSGTVKQERNKGDRGKIWVCGIQCHSWVRAQSSALFASYSDRIYVRPFASPGPGPSAPVFLLPKLALFTVSFLIQPFAALLIQACITPPLGWAAGSSRE